MGEAAATFPALLEANARHRGDRPAIREKERGIWQTWTWRQVRDEVRTIACGLAALGLARGDKVAVIGDNRPHLYWSMVAAQALGAVPVPLYQDAAPAEMQFVLDHTGARFAVVEDQEQVDKLLEIRPRCAALETIIYRNGRGLRHYKQEFLHSLDAVAERGRDFIRARPDFYAAEMAKAAAGDSAIMLYTSGTTGQPKGVVLTFDNLIQTARMSVTLEGLGADDETLSYLPMAWVGDNMFSLGQTYVAGFCINCPESSATVMHDLREIGPTYFFAPPRIFENILTQVMIRIEDAGAIKRRLFRHFMALATRVGDAVLTEAPVARPSRAVTVAALALGVAAGAAAGWLLARSASAAVALALVAGVVAALLARPRFRYFAFGLGRRGRPAGLNVLDRWRYGLGELLVYGPLKNNLGFSRMRLVYTAGEAIGPDIFRFYRSIGVPMKQLYGQTEATVFVTMQPNDQVRFDTVGVPCPGVEIKLADSGEVLYRSPGVFKEYYRNPAATAEAKTADGWVRTGDAGLVDRDGHLRIIDRAKDVGRLTGGALFAPKYIENKLKFFPAIKEAVIFGAGRDFVAALISIDLDAVGSWAEKRGLAFSSYQELAAKPEVMALIRGNIEQVNRDLAADAALAGSQIRRFVLLHKELDADDGELTRTRKVRRNFVADRYAPVIDAIYAGRAAVHFQSTVAFEDGRTGALKADLAIGDASIAPAAASAAAPPSAARAA